MKHKLLKTCLTCVLCVVSLGLTAAVALWGMDHVGLPAEGTGGKFFKAAMMDSYERYMTNQISGAMDGIMNIEKVYWLNDSDLIAPEPDPEKFGTTTDLAQVQAVVDAAAELLNGQETLFHPDITLYPGSEVTYYLDETILCITWRELIDNIVYTFSEVKIAHPSQFRRFLADGTYGSDKQYYCTQMAATVNAVTASNADFYKHRPYGVVVYNGEVYRSNDKVDTCFIDDQGELIMVPRNQLQTQEAVEAFVEENNIRFSLGFGPIMVEDGKNVVPEKYPVGQIEEIYSRAGLGYLGQLHYILVTAGFGENHQRMSTMRDFADNMIEFGCTKAYALDGGQTGTIVTNDRLINRPDYGTQRTVSDIIYFATAVPDRE